MFKLARLVKKVVEAESTVVKVLKVAKSVEKTIDQVADLF